MYRSNELNTYVDKVFFTSICAEDWNKKKVWRWWNCHPCVTLVKLSPMHAYLVVCALKKILSSGEGLNQPTQDFCVATRVITKIFFTCKAVVTKNIYIYIYGQTSTDVQQWSLNVPFRFVCFSDSYNQLQAKLEGVLRIQIRGGMGLMQNDKCLHAPWKWWTP